MRPGSCRRVCLRLRLLLHCSLIQLITPTIPRLQAVDPEAAPRGGFPPLASRLRRHPPRVLCVRQEGQRPAALEVRRVSDHHEHPRFAARACDVESPRVLDEGAATVRSHAKHHMLVLLPLRGVHGGQKDGGVLLREPLPEPPQLRGVRTNHCDAPVGAGGACARDHLCDFVHLLWVVA